MEVPCRRKERLSGVGWAGLRGDGGVAAVQDDQC